jgi:hypothetical protein
MMRGGLSVVLSADMWGPVVSYLTVPLVNLMGFSQKAQNFGFDVT